MSPHRRLEIGIALRALCLAALALVPACDQERYTPATRATFNNALAQGDLPTLIGLLADGHAPPGSAGAYAIETARFLALEDMDACNVKFRLTGPNGTPVEEGTWLPTTDREPVPGDFIHFRAVAPYMGHHTVVDEEQDVSFELARATEGVEVVSVGALNDRKNDETAFTVVMYVHPQFRGPAIDVGYKLGVDCHQCRKLHRLPPISWRGRMGAPLRTEFDVCLTYVKLVGLRADGGRSARGKEAQAGRRARFLEEQLDQDAASADAGLSNAAKRVLAELGPTR